MFYDIINQHVKIFGSVFSNILIKYYGEHHEVINEILVPIAYTGKDKMIQSKELRGDNPDNHRDVFQTIVPRMSFEMTGFTYNGSQKLNRLHEFTVYPDNNIIEHADTPLGEMTDNTADFYSTNYVKKVFSPSPYKINFNLYILSNREIQSMQILEQILPKFTPDIKIPVIYNLGPTMKLIFDESITFHEIYKEDLFNDDMERASRTVHILRFTMDCKFFREVSETRIIKNISFNIGLTDEGAETVESISMFSAPLDENIVVDLDKFYDYFYNDLYHDTENLATSQIFYE